MACNKIMIKLKTMRLKNIAVILFGVWYTLVLIIYFYYQHRLGDFYQLINKLIGLI